MDNKKHKTDREWRDAAKAALEALPPRANREKILRIIELWNDRVPEFFSRREEPSLAQSSAGCGRCIARYQDVFSRRIAMLDAQFEEEALAVEAPAAEETPIQEPAVEREVATEAAKEAVKAPVKKSPRRKTKAKTKKGAK